MKRWLFAVAAVLTITSGWSAAQEPIRATGGPLAPPGLQPGVAVGREAALLEQRRERAGEILVDVCPEPLGVDRLELADAVDRVLHERGQAREEQHRQR